ncbi:hypothetical protein ABPG75_009705 [Micractinium tetrahymenae]
MNQSAALQLGGGPSVPPPPARRCPPAPRSCDTFVALPSATADGSEVVACPGAEHPSGSSLRCTYISIPQAAATLAVVLSKPSWMWGAEMGANEAGVVCGNEAVWTVEDADGPPALLGMDLVRLALERGGSAAEAVDVITSLLEEHGQGGPCEEGGDWTYHNSFLMADAREAWVLETAGRCWVAQRITQGVRNISNCLSIRTAFDRCSTGLLEYAKQRGHWDGQGDFDWAAAFSDGGAPPLGKLTPGREANGHRLLQAAAGKIDPAAMMSILRDDGSGICMCNGAFRSNGSQVSQLWPPTADGTPRAPRHWFTATPDPQRSVFKFFAFPAAGSGQSPVSSPHTAAAPAPRNPPHELWRAWQGVYERRGGRKPSAAVLRGLEARGLDPAGSGLSFEEAVQRELELYGMGGTDGTEPAHG